ncbi:hypothetical protein HPB50_028390 [Hyalomma asiaticum]|nr:hypothetical protein HPB50_028390 [Hyalomma asiaticum]
MAQARQNAFCSSHPCDRPGRTFRQTRQPPDSLAAPSVDGHLQRSREKKRCLLTGDHSSRPRSVFSGSAISRSYHPPGVVGTRAKDSHEADREMKCTDLLNTVHGGSQQKRKNWSSAISQSFLNGKKGPPLNLGKQEDRDGDRVPDNRAIRGPGDGTGSTIGDFLRILEKVRRLGGWSDTELIGIERCKMAGAAFEFAWRDENVAAAVTYSEFETLALKRFDTEPMSSKIEKFWNAKQNAGEEVRSFAERPRILGTATLGIVSGEDPAKLSLRDPVRRFVLSHEPRTIEEAVGVAAREEQIDKLCTRSIHHGSDSAEERKLQNSPGSPGKHLPEMLLTAAVSVISREKAFGVKLDPRNESPDCQSTDIKSVEEAVARRLEKSSVAGHGEEKALDTTVDICGEDVVLEPFSEELEVSVMQWQVEMLASDEYGGESGDEVEKGSERDEVGEKPLEVMSESVAEIAPYEDKVALGSPEEAREEVPPGLRESADSLVSERETSIVKCTQETRTLSGNERRKR